MFKFGLIEMVIIEESLNGSEYLESEYLEEIGQRPHGQRVCVLKASQ